MADDQEQEAVGVAVELVLSQLPLHRVHALAGQVAVDLNLEPWQLLRYVTMSLLKVSTKFRGTFHIIQYTCLTDCFKYLGRRAISG